MSQKLKADYPDLQLVGSFSPPFRTLTPEEENGIIGLINHSGAQLVFVALGCPKQEAWMARTQEHIQAPQIGIGAALGVFTGHMTRAPLWMQSAGIEWLYRLCQEPRRLFVRYAVTNTLFIYYALFDCLQSLFGSLFRR